jgi:hypothetical protein
MRAAAASKPSSRGVMAFRIQKYLSGLHYPALHVLLRLPDRACESQVVLSREVGRQSAR